MVMLLERNQLQFFVHKKLDPSSFAFLKDLIVFTACTVHWRINLLINGSCGSNRVYIGKNLWYVILQI